MDFKEQIQNLIDQFLQERTDLFLIDLKISAADEVVVILDGDQGVSLQDCLDASRAIEFNMDRDAHDFSLQVMSAGLGEPLMLPRQYTKNIGREVSVLKENSEKTEGTLSEVKESGIVLTRKVRKPKEVGKGKVDVIEETEIPFSEIKKATIVIKF